MKPCDVYEKGIASIGGPRGAPCDAWGLSQPAGVESSKQAGTGNGLVTEGFRPVGVGDYVRIPDGRYGYVWTVSATGRTSGERAKPAVLVRIEEDDPAAETYRSGSTPRNALRSAMCTARVSSARPSRTGGAAPAGPRAR